MTDKDISEAVARIQERGAPDWFIPSYTKLLELERKQDETNAKLDAHIASHDRGKANLWEVWKPVLTTLLTVAVLYILSQAPAILATR